MVQPSFAAALIAFASTSFAQQSQHYFYKGLDYGSDATFNPVSVFLNGGFDELQIYGQTANLRDVPWDNGGTNVWRNVSDPFAHVGRYGWSRFIRQEILPTRVDLEHDQWFPNYSLHLIGGGMASRKLTEWYEAHGYPMPGLLSAATTMSAHVVNEIIENGAGGVYTNVDPIADLLVFDPLGILLFSNDRVSAFFSETVQLNDWSFAPALSFAPSAVRNVGQNFVLKVPLTAARTTSFFYHFGSFGLVGLSFTDDRDESISVGIGGSSKRAYTVDSTNGRTQSVVLGLMGGLYWDRNNSLLASLVVSDSFTEVVRLNLFPGAVSIGSVSPGAFVSFGRNRGLTVGITTTLLPIGVSGYHP